MRKKLLLASVTAIEYTEKDFEPSFSKCAHLGQEETVLRNKNLRRHKSQVIVCKTIKI